MNNRLAPLRRDLNQLRDGRNPASSHAPSGAPESFPHSGAAPTIEPCSTCGAEIEGPYYGAACGCSWHVECWENGRP